MRMFNTKMLMMGVLLLSLMALVLPISAQESSDKPDDPAQLVTVINAEYIETDEGAALHLSYEVTDNCLLPIITETHFDEEQNTLFISARRDLMSDERICARGTVTLGDFEVELDAPLEAEMFVMVNERLFRVTEDDDTLSLKVPNYTNMDIIDMQISATRSIPPQFRLSVTAEYLESCAVDFIKRIWSDEELGLISISLYYTMPDGVRCLPKIGTMRENFALGELESLYEITVNNHLMTYDFDTMEVSSEVLPPLPPAAGTPPGVIVTPQIPAQDTMKIDVAVESFEIIALLSAPPQISLTVNGYVDGCEFPIEYDVTQVGTEITVQVYREMPVGIACPAIAIYVEENINLGMLEMGHTYSITVNGITQTIDL